MSAKLIWFPTLNVRTCRNPPDQPCEILILPIVRIERECPKVQELRRQSKRLREHFKPKFSGGTCSGDER